MGRRHPIGTLIVPRLLLDGQPQAVDFLGRFRINSPARSANARPISVPNSGWTAVKVLKKHGSDEQRSAGSKKKGGLLSLYIVNL